MSQPQTSRLTRAGNLTGDGMRLSAAVEGFLYSKLVTCSPNTVADYQNTLRQFVDLVEDMDLDDLEAHHMQRFLYYLRVDRGLKPKTVQNAHTGLSAFCTWLEQELGIEHIMRGRVPRPKANKPEIVPLNKRDVRDLLLAMDRSAAWKTRGYNVTTSLRPTRARDRAIVLFLLDTGLRAQEMCDLVVGDVEMQTGAVQVRNGKGGKGRTVYIGQVAREMLWRYLSKRKFREASDPLFATNKHGHMDRHALRKLLQAAGERAELTEPVTPHRMRHTFAINFLRNGGNVFALQRLLGHSTMDMVRRYLALAETDMAEAHRRASPADNWRLG